MTDENMLKRWLPPLLIILAGVLAYWNSFDGVFVYDDFGSIRDNEHIRVLWPLREAMSFPLGNSGETVDGRPLLSLSLALNHHFLGEDPWGYHLINLLIHIAAGLLLFGLVRRTLDHPRFRDPGDACPTKPWRSRGVALAVALIWLVHPLQTESVTYIVQRAESLMGMLFLMTLYCAIRGFAGGGVGSQGSGVRGQGTGVGSQGAGVRGQGTGVRSQGTGCRGDVHAPASEATGEGGHCSHGRGGRAWLIAAILACAVGTGVKEIIITAPLLVLIYDGVFVSESLRSAITKRKWFYASLFATLSIPVAITCAGRAQEAGYFAEIGPVRYALTQPLVILYYLRLAVWPSPLVLEYGWPCEDQWHRIVFPGLAILGMLGLMVRGIRWRKWYGFVIAWFFLILGPTSSVLPLKQAIFEHRMYLSLASVVLLIVLGSEYAIRTLTTSSKQRVWVGGCLSLAVVIAFGCLTHDRNRDYHSGIGIWQDNIIHRPGNPLAHLNLGYSVELSGRHLDAIPHYREALRLKPDYAEARYNWGVALDALDRSQESALQYQHALRIKPDYAEAHNNLGHALQTLGHLQEAAAHCREAIRLKPNLPKAHNNLGNAVLALGDAAQAIAHYREALRLKPGYAETHYNLGIALDAAGRSGEALQHYQEAVRIDPGLSGAHYNLGNALLALGRSQEAIIHYQKAVQIKPDYAEAHNNWSIALYGLGHTEEAIAHGLQAVKINPADASTHNNLGAIYLESGRLAEAIQHFEEALRLNPDYALAGENLREAREQLSVSR